MANIANLGDGVLERLILYRELNAMDKYELYAVNHFLSSWPEGIGFKDLMKRMRTGDTSEVWPWELLEGVPPEDLAVLIEVMADNLEKVFK